MFGIGFFELCIIALFSLIFIGPQKLPDFMRKAAEIFVQFRRMSNEVKSAFDSAIKEAETTPEKKPLRKDQEVTPKLPTTDGG